MASYMDYIIVKHAEAFAWLRSKFFSSVDYIRPKSAEIFAWLKDETCSFLCEKIRDARDKGKHYYEDFPTNVEDILAKTKSNIDGIMEEITRTMSSCGCFNLMSGKSIRLWIEALDSMVRNARNIVVELGRMGWAIRKLLKGTNVLGILDTAEFFITSIAKFVIMQKNLRVLLNAWCQLGMGSPPAIVTSLILNLTLILNLIGKVEAIIRKFF